MDEAGFWEIIEDCHNEAGGEMIEKDRLIGEKLARLSEKDAWAFHQSFERLMDAAYTWPLWGAAYVLHGGCGYDSFADFRASLISRGRSAFERAMADPDSLAEEEIDLMEWFHGGFAYAIADAVRANIGRWPTRAIPPLLAPAGDPWIEPTVYHHYPKLTRRIATLV